MSSKSGNVFLAPCDPGNFDRTVRSSVDLSGIADPPDALSGMENVRFWGARDGTNNRMYFEKMESENLVLFYQDGEYVGTGWVGETFEDEAQWASENFWKNAPSRLIYTIEDFTPISIPKSIVNGIFGYSETYNPQGLMRVGDGNFEKRPESIKLALERYSNR